MSDDLKALYQAVILDHYKHPRHAGEPETWAHVARGDNPLCGDRITVWLTVEDGRVTAIGHEAVGCALSKASASLMCMLTAGGDSEAARVLSERVEALATGVAAPEGSDDPLAALSGVKDFPSRRTCVTMAWRALCAALDAPETHLDFSTSQWKTEH